MNSFFLNRNSSPELRNFPLVAEFALRKFKTVQLQSFNMEACECLQLYYITEGKFVWIIDSVQYTLYPGELALVLPGQSIISEQGHFDIGSFYSLKLDLTIFKQYLQHSKSKENEPIGNDIQSILNIMEQCMQPQLNDLKRLLPQFQLMQQEIINQEIGYTTKLYYIILDVLVSIARQMNKQSSSQRDFPQSFQKLDQKLRENLSHQWTVEEMAAIVGLGSSTFNEKVKNYTGFPPLNYLINIRISEAIRLLKKNDCSLTDIAYDTGFYSSQHFSTTFKKLTGYSPRQFRKNNLK